MSTLSFVYLSKFFTPQAAAAIGNIVFAVFDHTISASSGCFVCPNNPPICPRDPPTPTYPPVGCPPAWPGLGPADLKWNSNCQMRLQQTTKSVPFRGQPNAKPSLPLQIVFRQKLDIEIFLEILFSYVQNKPKLCTVLEISILRLLSAALLQPKKSRFDRKWPLISGWYILKSLPTNIKVSSFSFTYPI